MSTDSQQLHSPPTSLPYPEFRELTLKQKSFADNWLERMPGYKAAELAGYSGDYATLCQIASENLRKPEIADYIRERLTERHLSSDQVLAELGDIAAYPIEKMRERDSPIKGPDKTKALELVGRFHKLWTDKLETSPADLTTMLPQLVTLLQEARLAGQRARAIEGEVIEGEVVSLDNHANVARETYATESSEPSVPIIVAAMRDNHS